MNTRIFRRQSAQQAKQCGARLSAPLPTHSPLNQAFLYRSLSRYFSSQTRFKGYRQSAGVLVAEGGYPALWRGFPWRLFRQSCAVFLFDKISSEVAPVLFPHAFK